MKARHFRDDVGVTWTVYAVDGTDFPLAGVDLLPTDFRTGWLVFDNGRERRRYSPLPSHWAVLTEAELRDLLNHPRCRVVPRTTD